ncbi:hypothetical protein TW85_08145 [Marinomonas sp. S3726]|uniref:hypothetical protein n=1 Tax=Marinomonas sp. S3726 TaxID=579484 RepID=UPI0005FA894A|nr:hypothetical protein [Marinomonas sp. S3726]KJZ14690.1 hypothetical protein TW85_08145 [Marinomonas sp. S3726]
MSEILDAINALGEATQDMTIAKESFEALRQDTDQAISDHLAKDDAHSQYLKTEDFNEAELERNIVLKKLPIYPEVLTDDNRLEVTINSSSVSVADGQSFIFYGWLEVNTSDYAVKSFSFDSAKTYHLRFNLTEGFYFKDLADLTYNSNSLEDHDIAFDTGYDDMLVAEVKNGVLKVYKNVSDIPKGVFAAIETMDSTQMSGTKDLMVLSLDHGFARAQKVRIKTSFLHSSVTLGYGFSRLTLNEDVIYSTGRYHVGDDGTGYQYQAVNSGEYEFVLERRHIDSILSSTLETGTLYFNCNWYAGWSHLNAVSYLKAEVI